MHPILLKHYAKLATKYNPVGPYLEIGAAPGKEAVISGAYYTGKPDRFALNLVSYTQEDGITFLKCNSNDMRDVFEDNKFKTVISNAVLEHDRRFWRSIDEMKRILAPGGLMFVGAPGFLPRRLMDVTIGGVAEKDKCTITYDVHAKPDYWRFSRQAFQDIICEGLTVLELRAVGKVPRLVAVARKDPPAVEPGIEAPVAA